MQNNIDNALATSRAQARASCENIGGGLRSQQACELKSFSRSKSISIPDREASIPAENRRQEQIWFNISSVEMSI